MPWGLFFRRLAADDGSNATFHATPRDFRRGSGHRARLTFGDCFSYALATTRNEPLLFKGDDFGHTDVRRAV